MKKLIQIIIWLYIVISIFWVYKTYALEEETSSWTTIQYIIDSDPWINKSIFDEDTIQAIYIIEVIIIFFIFFFKFFRRILE
jgi:hypothetical protein